MPNLFSTGFNLNAIKLLLVIVFAGILIAMLAVTAYASVDRSILSVGPPLTSDPWFHATLVDAYCGFLTFYVWVAYKETRLWKKAVWFVLIMTLGNIAMSIYVLVQVWHWDAEQGVKALLLRAQSSPGRSPVS